MREGYRDVLEATGTGERSKTCALTRRKLALQDAW